MILQSLAGLPAFLVYICTAIIAVVAYLSIYARITPHNEFQLIRDNDPAAAIAHAAPGSSDEIDCTTSAIKLQIRQSTKLAEPVGADRGG